MIAEVDTYLEIARVEVGRFNDDNEKYVEFLVVNEARRWVMFKTYNRLIENDKIIELGKLPEQKRKAIWEGAKELAKGRLDNTECIRLAKGLYVLYSFNG